MLGRMRAPPEPSSVTAAARPTRTKATHQSLREQIIAGALAPSEKLNIAQLACSMEVSPGAVREALASLEAEGMVLSQPQRGYTVAPVSAEDVKSLTEARVHIEQLCVADAMRHGDADWDRQLLATLQGLMRAGEQANERGLPSPAWSQAHDEFHRVLVAPCRNPWLLRMREQLYQQSERYRHLSAKVALGTRDVKSEHRKLVKAILARDERRVQQLVADHLSRTAALALKGSGPRQSARSRAQARPAGAAPT
jgi:DNA-binding GntR family transcriptional regulator